MPPLPDPLYEETKAKLERLDRRLNDSESFQIPRLRNHSGSLALQQQYAAESREDIESCRRELQILETFVDDISSQARRQEIYDQLDFLIPKVDELKKDFRAALLHSKKTIDAQAPSQREELLRSTAAVSAGEGVSRGASDDPLMNASEAVTDALRRTTQLMQQELERSVLSTQLLEESTQTMSTTSDIYSTFTTLISTSKHLITALETSDWMDRLLILGTLGVFLLVVAYILKKRVINKGIWLAFWWVKYLTIATKNTAQSVSGGVGSKPSRPSSSGASSSSMPSSSFSSSTSLTSSPATPTTFTDTQELIEAISSIVLASFVSVASSASIPSPTFSSLLAEEMASLSGSIATVSSSPDEFAPSKQDGHSMVSLASLIMEQVMSRASKISLGAADDISIEVQENIATESATLRDRGPIHGEL